MSRVGLVTLQDVVRQGEGTIVSEMDGETVMLSIENGKYYNLGSIGGNIWALMEEPISVIRLVAKLTKIYEVEQTTCEDHVISFLNHLLKEGLIHTGE